MRILSLILVLALGGPLAAQAPDAEAQYRVARRLVAEGSPQAAAALERVVETDPSGPFADDALLERAGLFGLPAWPEELGRLKPTHIGGARPYLERILRELRDGDRAGEAAYRMGLLWLEPAPGRNTEQARLLLLSLAAGEGRESSVARYALAWMAEQEGDLDRAEATYQRLRVDAPGSAAALRATLGVGRIRLRQAQPAAAAARFQEGLAAGSLEPALAATAAALRDVAVDAFLRRVSTTEGLGVNAGTRPTALAAAPTGGTLVAERKENSIVEYDAGGAVIDRWSVEQPLAVAVSPNGSRYAFSAAAVLRLEARGGTRVVVTPGEFGAISGGAVDDRGRVWFLDRKGERIGTQAAGVTQTEVLWQGDGPRLSGLVWDGNRLLAVDTRNRTLMTLDRDGKARTLGGELDRPSALAVDPAGRIVVICGKGSHVRFFDAAGAPLAEFATQGAGMTRATAVALATDGTLLLVEEGSGLRWRAR